MEYLLMKGADPNEHSHKWPGGHSAYLMEHTALTLAAGRGNDCAVRIFLRYHANRHEPSRNGATPFEWAVNFGHFDTARLIWDAAPHSGYVTHGTVDMLMALYGGDYATYQYFRANMQGNRYIQNVFVKIFHNASGKNKSKHRYACAI